jgi:hypothetical protein
MGLCYKQLSYQFLQNTKKKVLKIQKCNQKLNTRMRLC